MRLLTLLLSLVLLGSNTTSKEVLKFEPKWKVGDVRTVTIRGYYPLSEDLPDYRLGQYTVSVLAEDEDAYTVQVKSKEIKRWLSHLNPQMKIPIEWYPEFQ